MKKLLLVVLAVLLSAPLYAGKSRSRLSGARAYGEVTRDGRGHIKRSASAKREFMRETGYADGRPGYVVDHIVPLACGGPDDPSNMQWQSVEDAKAKDRWELVGCRAGMPGVVAQAFSIPN